MTDEQYIPPGYHEQESGAADTNYTKEDGTESWLYSCGHCQQLQTVDSRPVAGQKVQCKNCGKWFNLTQTRLYVPSHSHHQDAIGPVIEG